MNTFNKLNNWIKASPTYNYLSLLREQNNRRLMRSVISPRGNYYPVINNLWYEIGLEFKAWGLKPFKMYEMYLLETGELLNDESKFTSKPIVYIHTSLHTTSHLIEFTINNFQFKTDSYYPLKEKRFQIPGKGNEEISNELIKRFVFEFIENEILYPEGCFKKYQIVAQKCKELTKDQYRDQVENRIFTEQRDPEMDLPAYYLRKYNVDISEYVSDWNAMHRKIISLTKGKKLKKTLHIRPFRPIEILDGFDGDIDEAEDLLNQYIEDQCPENTILI